MKRLSNGAVVYYPRLIGAKIVAVLFVFLALISTFGANDGVFALITWLVTGVFVWQGFFHEPVCTVYPERIEWYFRPFLRQKTQSLFWEEITHFYLQEEWKRQGKTRILVNVLVLGTAMIPKGQEPYKIDNLFLLGKKDQEDVLNALRQRGIPQGPDKKNEQAPSFIKNLFSR